MKSTAPGLQIVGIGLNCVDILIRLGDMPTWESSASLRAIRLDGGGPVGTALVAAARLGARVGYIGTIGNDAVGALKRQYLSKEGIDTSQVKTRPYSEPNLVLVFVHEESAERVFAIPDDYYKDPLRPDELDRQYITSADYLHLDGIYGDAALQAAKWMREAGKRVVLDAIKTEGKPDPILGEIVAWTDVLISGSGFVRGLTGEDDFLKASKSILGMGPQIIVETRGEQGSFTVTQNEAFHTPAFRVEALDTTGAGDVFHGAYIFGLIHGWDVRRMATFATAMAAIKCTRLGGRNGIPTLDEVNNFLAERNMRLDDKT